MGNNLTWVASTGRTPESFLSELGLRRTSGVGSESPQEGEYTGIDLGNGWYVVVLKGSVSTSLSFEALSGDSELVFVNLQEMMNLSIAESWINGQRSWEVMHHPEGNDGDYLHLAVEGGLPEPLDEIRTRVLQRAAEVGEAEGDLVFDIPVKIAEKLTDFCLDAANDHLTFEALAVEPGGTIGKIEKRHKRGCWLIAFFVLLGVGIFLFVRS